MKVVASKIIYKGVERIALEIPYNTEILSLIKQIPDARWNRSICIWHIPYSSISYKLLVKLFPDVEIRKDNQVFPEEKENVTNKYNKQNEISTTFRKSVSIEVAGRSIFLKMPKGDADIQFVRSFKYSRFDAVALVWIIPHYRNNLELLKEYFGQRLIHVGVAQSFETNSNCNTSIQLNNDSVLIIKTISGRLRVIFSYSPAMIDVIKKIPYSIWDAKNKWWSVPFSDKFLEQLKTCAVSQNLSVNYEEEKSTIERVARITPFDISNYRSCPEQFLQKMSELRYSEHTIQTYKGMFE